MRFASLGSGSRGNSLIVEAGGTRIMIDCGFSARSTLARLAQLGVDPASIDGLLLTHEHSDHVAGAVRFSSRHDIPLFLTHGTHAALSSKEGALSGCRVIDSHLAVELGNLEITPFPVPHDAREPVQYVVSDGVRRLGVLTDCGIATPHVIETLGRCHALVLECNHDPDLLAASGYPAALKKRIAGRQGHLSNEEAARLLGSLDHCRLQHVVAAHLSEENNRPELAVDALAGALGCDGEWIGVADQETGFSWRTIC